MTRQKQTNLNWYIAGAVFVIVLIVILSICSRCRTFENADAGDSDFRIVSLAPNVTEMLFALGLADCVIGVTDCCNYPPEANDIECVGSFGRPNIEKLLAMHPELVIAADFERNDTAAMLSESGIEVLELKIGSFEEMFDAFRTIGRATGKLPEAETIVDAIGAELKAIAEKFSETDVSQRPRVFVEIWSKPITTAGQQSFLDEVITRAGGINVAGEINQAYPHINPEKVIEWNPDIIILCYMTGTATGGSLLADRLGWSEISAVRENRIIDDIQLEYILRPGPRLIEGVEMLAKRFYAR